MRHFEGVIDTRQVIGGNKLKRQSVNKHMFLFWFGLHDGVAVSRYELVRCGKIQHINRCDTGKQHASFGDL